MSNPLAIKTVTAPNLAFALLSGVNTITFSAQSNFIPNVWSNYFGPTVGSLGPRGFSTTDSVFLQRIRLFDALNIFQAFGFAGTDVGVALVDPGPGLPPYTANNYLNIFSALFKPNEWVDVNLNFPIQQSIGATGGYAIPLISLPALTAIYNCPASFVSAYTNSNLVFEAEWIHSVPTV